MQVALNGKPTELPPGAKVHQVLELLGYKQTHCAVWVNGRKLLQAEYATLELVDGDEVRTVRLFSGG